MRGLSTRRTSLGWDILRIHYSADEDKDPTTPQGRAWLEKAREGMSEARWRKEFEIDYGALGGQLVFPEFEPSLHVIDPVELDHERWSFYMACDPHTRTPHALLWLAVNRDGDQRVVGEVWPSEQFPVSQYATVIKWLESDATDKPEKWVWCRGRAIKVRRRVMDTHGRAVNSDEGDDFFTAFARHGIHFQPAKKNIEASTDAIRRLLRPMLIADGKGARNEPLLRVFSACEELISEFQNVRYSGDAEMAEKRSEEVAATYRKHCLDCLIYLQAEAPRYVRPLMRGPKWEPVVKGMGS